MKKVTVLHDFDGKPYFKALERVAEVTYLNTRPLRFMLRDLVKYRKIQRETLASLLFLLRLPFIRNQTILLGMAPFNIRLLIYSTLCRHNHVWLHTSWHQWQGRVPFEYPAPLRGWLQRLWHRRLPHFAGAVAVTAETQRSLASFQPVLASRITAIPHVVDMPPISADAFAEKWQRRPDTLLFTGRLTAAKGVDTLLTLAEYAAQTTPELRFHAAGRGELQAQLEACQRQQGNLQFHGFIGDRAALRQLMARSHFFLLPSRRVNGWEELFGLVVIEAMSQGCVVIATDHIGPREIISDRQDGVLCSEANFIPTVQKIIAGDAEDYTAWQEIARHALITSQTYSEQIIAGKWSALFD